MISINKKREQFRKSHISKAFRQQFFRQKRQKLLQDLLILAQQQQNQNSNQNSIQNQQQRQLYSLSFKKRYNHIIYQNFNQKLSFEQFLELYQSDFNVMLKQQWIESDYKNGNLDITEEQFKLLMRLFSTQAIENDPDKQENQYYLQCEYWQNQWQNLNQNGFKQNKIINSFQTCQKMQKMQEESE